MCTYCEKLKYDFIPLMHQQLGERGGVCVCPTVQCVLFVRVSVAFAVIAVVLHGVSYQHDHTADLPAGLQSPRLSWAYWNSVAGAVMLLVTAGMSAHETRIMSKRFVGYEEL